jgi:phage baseplate assembly protein W
LELKLENGRYIAGTRRGLDTVSGNDELCQRVGMKLSARRGAYPLMPNYGSRLYTLSGIKPSQREAAAKQFIAEALEDEENLVIGEVSITERENGSVLLEVSLSVGDTDLNVSVGG